MDLLLLGAGMGMVGGLFPSPLHMIALAQLALKRRALALLVLVGPPLVVDGALLLVTFFFYKHVPHDIAHDVAYLGGAIVLAFGAYSLVRARGKSQEEMARSGELTYTSVSVGVLAQADAPGTWVYWLTIAGTIIAEGRRNGCRRVDTLVSGGPAVDYG